jgi:molybdate transport system substrate-binding protein
VRAGAPRPDISTPGALKRTLLNAQSIATIPASATGAQLLQVFDVLGIRPAMKLKTRAQSTPAQIVQTVANGDGELAVFLMNVLMAPGLDVVGPLPAELQREVVFTAAVAVHTRQADAARAFITYLTTPAAIAVLKSKGLNPG